MPSFGLIPKIKCVHKYPIFYRQERSIFDSHDPADLKQEKRRTKFASLSSLERLDLKCFVSVSYMKLRLSRFCAVGNLYKKRDKRKDSQYV